MALQKSIALFLFSSLGIEEKRITITFGGYPKKKSQMHIMYLIQNREFNSLLDA